MIPQEVPPMPTATNVLEQKREPLDWTFGTMGQRAKLRMGNQEFGPDHPQYELIKNLILQKYLGNMYGQR